MNIEAHTSSYSSGWISPSLPDDPNDLINSSYLASNQQQLQRNNRGYVPRPKFAKRCKQACKNCKECHLACSGLDSPNSIACKRCVEMNLECTASKRHPRGRKRKGVMPVEDWESSDEPAVSQVAAAVPIIQPPVSQAAVVVLKVKLRVSRKPPVPSGGCVLLLTSATSDTEEDESVSVVDDIDSPHDKLDEGCHQPDTESCLPAEEWICSTSAQPQNQSDFQEYQQPQCDDATNPTNYQRYCWEPKIIDRGVEQEWITILNAHNWVARQAKRLDEMQRIMREQEEAASAENAMKMDIDQFLVF